MQQFASERIQARFQEAAATFLDAAHQSMAAQATVKLLSVSPLYANTKNRNDAVKLLASDVEAAIGIKANLLFRTPGALHDSLQTLMDAYMDAADGIYYAAK